MPNNKIDHQRHLRLQVVEFILENMSDDYEEVLYLLSHWYSSQVSYYYNIVIGEQDG